MARRLQLGAPARPAHRRRPSRNPLARLKHGSNAVDKRCDWRNGRAHPRSSAGRQSAPTGRDLFAESPLVASKQWMTYATDLRPETRGYRARSIEIFDAARVPSARALTFARGCHRQVSRKIRRITARRFIRAQGDYRAHRPLRCPAGAAGAFSLSDDVQALRLRPESAFHRHSSRALSEPLYHSLQSADRLSYQSRHHLNDICMHGAVVIIRIEQNLIQTTRHRLHLQELLSLGFDRLR
jgi:hypothetical protein